MDAKAAVAVRGPRESTGIIRRATVVAVEHPVATTFAVAFLVRATIAVFIDSLFGGALVTGDSLGYHDMAASMESGNTAHWDPFTQGLYWRTITFVGPLTAVYRLVGPSILAGSLFVAALGAATAAVAARLAGEGLPGIWPLAVGTIVALLPGQIIWSSVTLKDPMVWLLVALLALVVSRAGVAGSTLRLALWGIAAGGLLFGLAYLRPHTMVIAGTALALTSWVGGRRYRMARIVGAAVLAVSAPWIVGLGPAGYNLTKVDPENMRLLNAVDARSAVVEPPVPEVAAPPIDPSHKYTITAEEPSTTAREKEASTLVTEAAASTLVAEAAASTLVAEAEELEEKAKELEASGQSAAAAEARREAARLLQLAGRLSDDFLARGAGGEEGVLDPNLRHLPRGVSVILLEPYPWGAGGSAGLQLARLETVVWYPVVLLALVGLVAVLRHSRLLLFPLVWGGATVVVYALTEGNLGTAYRHRGEFVWAVALFAGFGAVRIAQRWLARAARPS